MSFDPDKPLPEREPEQSGPWRPPQLPRGPVNPPETRRKAKAKLGNRPVRTTMRKRTVFRADDVRPVQLPAPRPVQYRVGERIKSRNWYEHELTCPMCQQRVPELIHQLPTARVQWACDRCNDPKVKWLGR